jgi:hypothetical protein
MRQRLNKEPMLLLKTTKNSLPKHVGTAYEYSGINSGVVVNVPSSEKLREWKSRSVPRVKLNCA